MLLQVIGFSSIQLHLTDTDDKLELSIQRKDARTRGEERRRGEEERQEGQMSGIKGCK